MDGGLLQETKAILRSLIVSCPGGLTIEGLARDYRKSEGEQIPYARLGFNRLEPFLMSLTDTLVVHGSGPTARVTPIITRNLEHINQMVLKQRNATRERKRQPLRSNHTPQPQPMPQAKPLPVFPQYNYNPVNNYLYNSQPGLLHPPINYQVQYPIYNAPRYNANIITPQLLNAIISRNNTQFHSLNNNSRRFNSFNSTQKRTTAHNCQAKQQNTPTNLSTMELPLPNRTNDEGGQNSNEVHKVKNGSQFTPGADKTTEHNSHEREQCTAKNLRTTEPALPNKINYECAQGSSKDNKLKNGNLFSSGPQKISEQFHGKTDCTLKNQPTIEPKLERAETRTCGDYTFEANNLKKNSNHATETTSSKIKFKLPSKNYIDTKLKSKVFDNNSPHNVKNSSSLSLASVSDISNASEKSTMSFDKFKKSFTEIENGIKSKSTTEIESRNTTNTSVNLSIVKNEEKTMSRNKSKNDLDSSLRQEAVPDLLVNDIVFLIDYPPGCVKVGESISPLEIPSDMKVDSWFGIFITEVHNPYKFWFHLHKENHEIDTLMNDIEIFYKNSASDELNVNRNHLRPDLVCAALFENMWHRAIILQKPVGESVKMHFIDYGTVSDVHVKNVKYLLSDFATLKAQALRGCLADIKPVRHRWSRDATYAFLDMVCDLLLYAKATEIDYKNNVVQMILTDTNDDIDFQINDALIKKGYARYSPEPRNQSENELTPPRRRHFQENYPTFEMLETGKYPSFAEIGAFLARGIDFEARQDENILADIDDGCKLETFAQKLTKFTLLEDDSIQDIPNDPRCNSENTNTLKNYSPLRENNTNATPSLHNNSTNPFMVENNSMLASRRSFDGIRYTPSGTNQYFAYNNQCTIPNPYIHQNPIQYSSNLHPEISNSYAMYSQQFQPVAYTSNPLRSTLGPPPGFENHVINRNLSYNNDYK